MFNKLEEIIKNSKGNVLIIELDQKLIDCFNKNNHVNLISISSNKKNTVYGKSKKKFFDGSKNINIKKLRKYINKKSVDILICNMNEMNNYYKHFIKDSIYLNNNMIYLYFDKNIDKDFLIDKYKRYNVKIELNEYKNGYIVIIDNKNGKNNVIKDIFYIIKDTFYNIAEFIGNILVN